MNHVALNDKLVSNAWYYEHNTQTDLLFQFPNTASTGHYVIVEYVLPMSACQVIAEHYSYDFMLIELNTLSAHKLYVIYISIVPDCLSANLLQEKTLFSRIALTATAIRLMFRKSLTVVIPAC